MVGGEEKVRSNPEGYREYKKLHALNSVERVKEIILKADDNGYYSPSGFVKDLTYLILRHELGGEKLDGMNLLKQSKVDSSLNLNDLSDIVTDSDSLAYFDANILTNWEECGKDKALLGKKVHFMYDRMTTDAQAELRALIIFSDNHVLGSRSDDTDINAIREVLLEICN